MPKRTNISGDAAWMARAAASDLASLQRAMRAAQDSMAGLNRALKVATIKTKRTIIKGSKSTSPFSGISLSYTSTQSGDGGNDGSALDSSGYDASGYASDGSDNTTYKDSFHASTSMGSAKFAYNLQLAQRNM
jgi:hypothetical protein